ncbi:hypothetical protein [Streptomyces sp. NBC_00102]|uniref:hypothetical protein n=1 Tax=Streptomyces sp. NBC_00102 TaxID=2975652 RepID=UPI00224DCB77|nr:hypothetical protein [Streptomyces sp. NBC_00102]MCX5398448.1 hypothetical protein [Streptomyces sp. NBC_00102]
MSKKKSHKAPKNAKHGKHGKAAGFDEGSGEPGTAASAGPSTARLLLKVGTSGLAIFRGVKRIRRHTGADKLLAADAVAGLLPVITAAAIVVRQLRRKPQSAQATP